jgi:hypothetical protein
MPKANIFWSLNFAPKWEEENINKLVQVFLRYKQQWYYGCYARWCHRNRLAEIGEHSWRRYVLKFQHCPLWWGTEILGVLNAGIKRRSFTSQLLDTQKQTFRYQEIWVGGGAEWARTLAWQSDPWWWHSVIMVTEISRLLEATFPSTGFLRFAIQLLFQGREHVLSLRFHFSYGKGKGNVFPNKSRKLRRGMECWTSIL